MEVAVNEMIGVCSVWKLTARNSIDAAMLSVSQTYATSRLIATYAVKIPRLTANTIKVLIIVFVLSQNVRTVPFRANSMTDCSSPLEGRFMFVQQHT